MTALAAESAQDLSPAELHRLLANVARLGRVEQVHPAEARCRVRTGELLTTWVPWLAGAAGGAAQARHWRVPQVGEQVLLIAPGGDLAQAVAFAGLFCDDMPQGADTADLERHDFSATDYWQHQRGAAALVFDIAGSITLRVGASRLHLTPEGALLETPALTVDSPASTFTGKVTVQGLLSYQAGIAGKAGQGSGNTVEGGFAVQGGAITHDGKNIGATHTHPGDSGGTTGAPN